MAKAGRDFQKPLFAFLVVRRGDFRGDFRRGGHGGGDYRGHGDFPGLRILRGVKQSLSPYYK